MFNTEEQQALIKSSRALCALAVAVAQEAELSPDAVPMVMAIALTVFLGTLRDTPEMIGVEPPKNMDKHHAANVIALSVIDTLIFNLENSGFKLHHKVSGKHNDELMISPEIMNVKGSA